MRFAGLEVPTRGTTGNSGGLGVGPIRGQWGVGGCACFACRELPSGTMDLLSTPKLTLFLRCWTVDCERTGVRVHAHHVTRPAGSCSLGGVCIVEPGARSDMSDSKVARHGALVSCWRRAVISRFIFVIS